LGGHPSRGQGIFNSILLLVIIHCVYQVKCAWQLLWIALHFHGNDVDDRITSFKEQIDKFFPPQPSDTLVTFSTSLEDLESAGLRVKLTKNVYEHLLVEEDTVNIYQLHYEPMKMWFSYQNNKAAKYVVPSEKYAAFLMLDFLQTAGNSKSGKRNSFIVVCTLWQG
jgi:hypothetical protein